MLLQFKIANVVSETEFQRGHVHRKECLGGRKGDEGRRWHSGNLWAGLVGPRWQYVPSAIAAVI